MAPARGFQPLGHYLPREFLARVGVQWGQLSELQASWRQRVDEPLASHGLPVRYHAGRLTVLVSSSAWASKIRHRRSVILQALHTDPHFKDLTAIEIRVVPEQKPPPAGLTVGPAGRPRPHLSTPSAGLIREVAKHIADPGLQAALYRLAGNGR